MFNKDFYPTPAEVIATMLQELPPDLTGLHILEPSAGKGDIARYLKNLGANVSVCEIDYNLVKILKTEFEVVELDFLKLTSEECSHFDYIIMNPPFSDDETHILHAWEVAPQSCEIIALCNTNTLTNHYSKKRIDLKTLVSSFGYDEYLGSVFKTSERPTEVEVSLIHLYKPQEKGEDEFKNFLEEEEPQEQADKEGLISYNVIRDAVNRYIKAVQIFDLQTILGVELYNTLNGVTYVGRSDNFCFVCKQNELIIDQEKFKRDLQRRFWRYIFSSMKMDKYLTQSFSEKLNKFIEKRSNVPFTQRNINNMLDIIIQTHPQRIKELLINTFDKICSYAPENSTAGETWKTNSHYKINRKFIIPYIAEYRDYGDKETARVSYNADERLNDIVKGFCYLLGIDYNKTSYLSQYLIKFNTTASIKWGQEFDWFIFTVRLFKKGTAHFKFQNEEDLNKFNRYIAEIKWGELPTKQEERGRKKETFYPARVA